MFIFSASSAKTLSPLIADALSPINLGRKKVPTWVWYKSNFTKCLYKACAFFAITISQANAMLAPAPAATPFTAIIGFPIVLIFLIIGL